jgi:hypothetical protein
MLADTASTKVCPGFTGDMLETDTDAPPAAIDADPLGGGLTAVIVTPAGAVRTSELIDELPDGVAFLNVAVSDTVVPAATDAGDMASVNIFSGVAATPGNANAASVIAAKKQSILRMQFMEVSVETLIDTEASGGSERSDEKRLRKPSSDENGVPRPLREPTCTHKQGSRRMV